MTDSTKSKGNLRFIIYGAGAIGGQIGGRLALAGKEVIIVDRPGQVNAIKENGLRLITPKCTHTLHLMAVTTPDQISFKPNDVVLLAVKSQNTDEALRGLHAVVKDVPIFCCQNSVRNEETAAKYFPNVYGVWIGMGGLCVKYGEVTAKSDTPGRLIMGRYPSGMDSLLEVVADSLRKAGFSVLVTADIMPYKWAHLVTNLANAIGAITNSRMEDSRPILEAIRKESAEILSQAGIRWISDEDIAREHPEMVTVGGSDFGPTRHTNSTWQSLTRKEGVVETDFFNGEVVRIAKRLGKSAPVNETLLRITQEMATKREVPGKYTTSQLIKLLGLS